MDTATDPSVTTTTATPTSTTTPEPTTTTESTTAAPTTASTTDVPTTDGTTEDTPVMPPRSLDEIVDGQVQKITEGYLFTEGPVWHSDGFLLFSDIGGNTIYRWDERGGAAPFIKPSGNSNGLIFDHDGHLLAAEHGNRRVSRRVLGEEDATTVVDTHDGAKLNSPNDLVLRSDGTLYFTDPPYGIAPDQQEQAFNGVYRIDLEGQIHVVATDFDRPNGIVLSPDETTLYVSDTTHEHVRSFTVAPDGQTSGGEIFVDLQSDLQGNPDGMAVDEFGNLYVTGGGGIRVVTPAGAILGTITVPLTTTNVTFGDPDYRAIFITAPSTVYRVRLKVKGANAG